MVEYVLINGMFIEKEKAMISVFDYGFLYGDGVYTTLRTYYGNIFLPGEYIRRLFLHARAVGITMPVSEQRLVEWMKALVAKNGFSESRIRVTASSGVSNVGLQRSSQPTVVIFSEKLEEASPSIYEKGVRVITVRGVRWMPEVKSLQQLPSILARKKASVRKAYDAVFVDHEGFVLESTIANIFFIQQRTLYTPDVGILSGVTRDIVLRLAKQLGLKIVLGKIKRDQAYRADECFLTNTTKGIVPVVKIDGQRIGRGKPGQSTLQLRSLFLRFVSENSERMLL